MDPSRLLAPPPLEDSLPFNDPLSQNPCDAYELNMQIWKVSVKAKLVVFVELYCFETGKSLGDCIPKAEILYMSTRSSVPLKS